MFSEHQPDDCQSQRRNKQKLTSAQNRHASYLLTSSADSAMKKPCVAFSMRTLGPGLIARVLSLVSSCRTSIAPRSSFNLVKHNL